MDRILTQQSAKELIEKYQNSFLLLLYYLVTHAVQILGVIYV